MYIVQHLGNGSSLVDGNKYFVQQCFEVVASDAVHHEAFQRRHWKSIQFNFRFNFILKQTDKPL